MNSERRIEEQSAVMRRKCQKKRNGEVESLKFGTAHTEVSSQADLELLQSAFDISLVWLMKAFSSALVDSIIVKDGTHDPPAQIRYLNHSILHDAFKLLVQSSEQFDCEVLLLRVEMVPARNQVSPDTRASPDKCPRLVKFQRGSERLDELIKKRCRCL